MADAIRSVDSVRSLDDRIVSGFPISIGTSLALETLFDTWQPVYDASREVPDRVQLDDYSEVWISVDTLIRNFIGSIPKDMAVKTSAIEMAAVVYSEMQVIEQMFLDARAGIAVRYYDMVYRKLAVASNAKKVTVRTPNTESATYMLSVTEEVKIALATMGAKVESVVDRLRSDYSGGVAMVMCHRAYDLLSYSRFKRLDLLQSHTGKIVSRAGYSELYYPMAGVKIENMPYFEEMLYVMGDRNQIHPYTPSLRRAILGVAATRGWNSYTTFDKVRLDLSLDLDDKLKQALPWL